MLSIKTFNETFNQYGNRVFLEYGGLSLSKSLFSFCDRRNAPSLFFASVVSFEEILLIFFSLTPH